MKRRLKTAVAMIVLAVASGCGPEPLAPKDTLVMEVQSSPTNLDARVGNDNVTGRMLEMIYSGLVKVTPDMSFAPDIAEKWETPDDKTVIFHLNPAAKFQNGQPVTAADVKWTYDSLMSPTFVTSKKSGYAAVDRIETPDAHTVIFRLKTPNGGLFDNLTLGIMPRGADTNVYKTRPIGAGPYRVVKYETDDRLVLEAFDQWHGGAPKTKHVVVRIIPDATTRTLELRRGTVNFELNQIPFETINAFARNDAFQVNKKPGSVYQYLAFNLRDPILAKKAVRQAIAYAIDRERIARDVMGGYAVVTDSVFGEEHWARATDLPTYPFNPAKARQLLDAAGYPDPDGNGPKMRFTLTFKSSTDAEANLRAQVIQQMLRDVGIDVKIQTSEFGTFMDQISKGNFQMYSLSRNGIQDPDFLYVLFYSKNLPPGGQNRGYYANPRVDQLLIEGRSTFDRAKRKPKYDEIQRILQDELPYLSLYHQVNAAVMRRNVGGFVMYPAGYLLSVPQMTVR